MDASYRRGAKEEEQAVLAGGTRPKSITEHLLDLLCHCSERELLFAGLISDRGMVFSKV